MNMNCSVFLIVIHLIVIIHTTSAGNQLHEHILHYEPLDYDHNDVLAQHRRNKRSSDHSKAFIHIQFRSHEKLFRLKLKRDTSTLSSEVQIVSEKNIPLDVDILHLYHGSLLDEPESQVYGSIAGGVFDGNIHTSDGVFYVQKTWKYPELFKNVTDKIHSVIYHSSNIIDPFGGLHPSCGMTESDLRQMKLTGVKEEGEEMKTEDSSWYKYSRRANSPKRVKRRAKREATTCSIAIRTDPTVWQHFYTKQDANSERVSRTEGEITMMIAQHIQAVNAMFQVALFDSQYPNRLFHFEVQRIQIDNTDSCAYNYAGERSKFCEKNIDARNFLTLHSTDNHADFCLSYIFSHRDFPQGVVGLAWVGVPDKEYGVCARRSVFESRDDPLVGVPLSLNTGMISFVNYNRVSLPVVSQLTLAHEIGHNFGSSHDPDEGPDLERCSPGNQKGNYVMFASATNGNKQNNFLFSNCSNHNITLLLNAVYQGKHKRNCFIDHRSAYCGNKMVEGDEECDCGLTSSECHENCCYPRVVSDADKKANPKASGCKRRPGAVCSPSEGLCCQTNCKFVRKNFREPCKEATECTEHVFCDGRSPKCKPPVNKPEGTECSDKSKVCSRGYCSESICSKFKMKECFIIADDKGKQCELACQLGNDSSTCKGTSEMLFSNHNRTMEILHTPGSPCNNYQGYCDELRKCRPIAADGPIVRAFSYGSLVIVRWVPAHWWAVLLACVTLIVVTSLLVKCCSVHTPSSNPSKTPHLRFRETLRDPYGALKRYKTLKYKRKSSEQPVSLSQNIPAFPNDALPYTFTGEEYRIEAAPEYPAQNVLSKCQNVMQDHSQAVEEYRPETAPEYTAENVFGMQDHRQDNYDEHPPLELDHLEAITLD